MAKITFDDLLSTGAHFGHVTRKWNPNFKPYVLMERNGVHIINLEETLKGLEKAQNFVKDIVQKKGEILFVGTKKQAKDIVQQEADRCGMFYVVERWLGGTLTNFSTIKKSIKRLQILEKESSSIYENLTKKELQMLHRERIKLSDQHRGIKDMRRLPNAIVIVDIDYEATAVLEAKRLDIPIISIVDSNTDPRNIDYPIPANDDSIRTIQLIVSALADVVIDTLTEKKEKMEQATKEKEEAKQALLLEKAEAEKAAVAAAEKTTPTPKPEKVEEVKTEKESSPKEEDKTAKVSSEKKTEGKPKKSAVKKTTEKKAISKKVTVKTATKKTDTKKSSTKETTAKKTVAKKSTAKKTTKKKSTKKKSEESNK
ncbi:MAG: 30S ribosomal protein S2 [Candidatus Marinimicrobia bacterium]|nr:30S ribosomal protein S2 [Candidatus Neomarinimicrobiota bacterium]MBL7059952.1 30S ribosomal protein S2 [Candidatus Neomarinimicrobiota bacterium]